MTTTLPHNLDAEKSIIGGLIDWPDRIIEFAADLAATDFYDHNYGSIGHVCYLVRQGGHR
jgi:replicative DNA helicase